jgi:hypothetical protein
MCKMSLFVRLKREKCIFFFFLLCYIKQGDRKEDFMKLTSKQCALGLVCCLMIALIHDVILYRNFIDIVYLLFVLYTFIRIECIKRRS